MDDHELPHRGRHARRDEGGLHQGAVDFFADRGIEYLSIPVTELRRAEPADDSRCSSTWGERLGVTEDESDFAHDQGLEGARAPSTSRHAGRRAAPSSRTVEMHDNAIAILVVVGAPYHLDPG